MKLTTNQKKIMNSINGVYRWTYNRCVDYHLENMKEYASKQKKMSKKHLTDKECEKCKGKNKEKVIAESITRKYCRSHLYLEYPKYSKKELRSKFVNETALKDEFPWVLDIPYDIRDEAMNEFLIRHNTFGWKLSDFKFKNRKQTQTFVLYKKHYRHKTDRSFTFCKSKLKDLGDIKTHEKMPIKLPTDTKIIKTRTGDYYIAITDSFNTRVDTPERAVGIDLGVRDFFDSMNTAGTVEIWGKGDIYTIYGVCKHMDSLISKQQKKDRDGKTFLLKHKKRYKLQKAINKLRERVFFLKKDIHYKAAKHIVSSNRIVFLPQLGISNMVMKKSRKIGKKTVRQMLCWSPGEFRQTIISKAREYNTVIVEDFGEEWTSKSCPSCGKLNFSLGSKKIFDCRECSLTCDRDVGASKNILVKGVFNVIIKFLTRVLEFSDSL